MDPPRNDVGGEGRRRDWRPAKKSTNGRRVDFQEKEDENIDGFDRTATRRCGSSVLPRGGVDKDCEEEKMRPFGRK